MSVRVHSNADSLGADVATLIKDASAKAIADHGQFTVAFSGGSLPKIVGAGLVPVKNDIDFSKWHVFFSDERCVELEHDDSNYKACKEALFDHVGIPSEQIYTIDAKLNPSDAAADYSKKLRSVWGSELPRFDMILLGMGPDGHTCSLFPDHPLLNEDLLYVASISDSPKPPLERITLTYPVVNNAANVAFVATGGSKADLMPHMLGKETRESPLPAARVHPKKGDLYWFLDTEAAAKISDDAKM